MAKVITFFIRSPVDDSLLAGLTPTFEYYRRRDSGGGITDLTDPAITEKGAGLYEFTIPTSDITAGSIIKYSIDCTASASVRYLEDELESDAILEAAAASGYIEEGIDARAEVLQGTTDTVDYWPKLEGQNVTPASSTVAIYNPAGGVVVAEAAVVVGTNGRLRVSQAWATASYPLAEDYCALFTYVYGGVTYTDRVFFDVVKTKLFCQISHTDLLDIYPDLEEHLTAIGETDTHKFIKRAWTETLDRIRNAGNRPSLILDGRRLISPTIHLALSYTCRALEKDTGDIWNERKKEHHERYDTLFKGLGEMRYDLNEDAISDKQELTRIARVRFHV